MYLFKNRIHEGLNINPFKNEESDKTSVDNTHTQGACGREPTDSSAVSVSHPSTIDAEYVFVFSNIVTIFKITLINDYFLIINSIMRSKPNFSLFVMLNLSVNLWFLVISIISIGYKLT